MCRRVYLIIIFTLHIRPMIAYSSYVENVGYLRDIRRLESLQHRWTHEVEAMSQMAYVDWLKFYKLFYVKGHLI